MKHLSGDDNLIKNARRIHLVGIGGSGMCPIAELLLSKGYSVSGSDKTESDNTKRLKSLGAKIFIGQSAGNIQGADIVGYSAAVHTDNPELKAARESGIPTFERSKLLGAITRFYDNTIGVSGTHGKTTVSSMITQILLLNKRDPSAVIGGKLPLAGSACVSGSSDTLVCESCEFVDSFLEFSPDISVLLNIDNDHLDYFKTMDNLVASFSKFCNKSKTCYYNGDDELCEEAVSGIDAVKISYGMGEDNFYHPANIKPGRFGFSFDVVRNNKTVGHLDMNVPGEHNIYNGIVSFAVCFDMGASAGGINEALKEFTGAGRRFQFIGEEAGVTVIDDYAHHPTEIAATLSAARSIGFKNVIVVFQPFTYSRVALLKDGMIKALSIADKVFLTPIVASREENIYGVSSEEIANCVPGGKVISDYGQLSSEMAASASAGDIVITMGAGDIFKVAPMILEKLK
ncbi:MAG: UDP-N-acetylmuramate--L-alanine ligase [Clostridia bacterium]|nr:UDP-N-acetylmuramate--L-alanine ligase [Clostridia bacterium]